MPEPTSEAWARIRYDYEHTTRPVEDICAEHGISSGTLRDRVRRWRWTRRRPPISRDGPPAVEPLPVQQFGSAARLTPTPTLPLSGGGSVAARQGEPAELPPLEKGRSPAEAAGEGGRVGIDASCVTTADPHPVASLSEGSESASAQTDAATIVQRLQGAVARVLPAIEAIIARLAAGPQHPREMEQAGRALGALMRTLRELNALLSQHNAQATEPYDDMPEDIDAFRLALAQRIRTFVASRRGDHDKAKAEET